MTSILAPRPVETLQLRGALDREYYSVTEAAAMLRVSRVTIWRWISAGRLPASRLGDRITRIKREDLERLLVQIGPAGSRSWIGRNVQAGAAAPSVAGMMEVPSSGGQAVGATEHFVQFYEADAVLLDAVAEYIGTGLRAGDAGIVIATEAHREGLAERLQTAGPDLAEAQACGQYVALDADETLSHFMVDGEPDPGRFAQVIGEVIGRAQAGGRHVRAFGEMVALLAGEGNHTATAGLEALWNDLQTRLAFSLFCAYPMEGLGGEALAELLANVCAEHSRVIPAESYTMLPTADERLRAITVLQQKAQSLEAALAAEQEARAAAEQALRLRDEFLSIASHELKTPLTSLLGYAQAVLRRLERDGQLEPQRVVQTLQMVMGQAQKLARLVNQLFDISRLEAGKFVLERQPTDLTVLVAQVVSDARAWSERHAITVEAPASLEANIDPLRLEQVLTNLLDNAIKYSPDAGSIAVVLRQTNAATAELSVRDWGLGIPPEKRERVFDRFYQAHRQDHRSGMGLGLYISRHIAESHGGEIRAEFPPNGGSRFVVAIPTDARAKDVR